MAPSPVDDEARTDTEVPDADFCRRLVRADRSFSRMSLAF